jgi:murein DD-endopeptidase MepM/ murein hydrolase activator NlpD
MQRLVYNPRAYVFTKNRQGQILDVSRYVTAGRVSRVVNAVSSAEITLRNPNMVFTTPKSDATTTFMPMDPITIYLERLKGRPVQVFTGFLDTTPYLQLYPGTIKLTASCTLKRLQYTFFDPALPYTQNFLAAYGWINEKGTVFNFNGLNDWQKEDADNIARYGDGSVAELLFATLKHIGHWGDNDIKIERLPHDLMGRLSRIYTQYQDNNKQALDEFENLLKNIIGAGEYGKDGNDASGGASLSTGNIKGVPKIVRTMVAAASKWNVPAEMVIATWRMEWPNLKDSPSNPHYGWFQWDVKHGTPGSYQGAGVTRKGDAYDCGQASDIFAEALHRNKVRNPNQDWHWLVERTQGVNQGTINNPLYRTDWDAKVAEARKLVSQYGKGTGADAPFTSPSDLAAVQQIKRADNSKPKPASNKSKVFSPVKNMQAASIGVGGGAYGAPRSYPGGHAGVDAPSRHGQTWYAICDSTVAAINQGWANGQPMVLLKAKMKFAGYPDPLYMGYGSLASVSVKVGDDVPAGGAIGTGGEHGSGPHLHFFLASSASATNGTMNPTSFLRAAAKGEQPSGGPGAAVGIGDASGGGASGSNTDSSKAFAIADSFRATFNFASIEEGMEAIGLFGERSLLNDKPLLPFIQQLCEASLRQFQSLPDGSIFAFYPDYFGEMLHHRPYWEINDIEVLNGGINLSDDALVTHQFVVGDVTWPASNELVNTLSTTGIVNVFNAFLSTDLTPGKADKTNNPIGMDLLLEKDEAAQFLNRFGARPNVEEQPMIHSHFYEFFLAYQRFMLAWARQFATPFEFTFMPELYPGGKVGFPDHGLQMYIEDVTHSWDYETGFTTEATLSAPSVYKNNVKGLPPHMVRAIISS